MDDERTRIVAVLEPADDCAYYTAGGCMLMQVDNGFVIPCLGKCREYSKKSNQ